MKKSIFFFAAAACLALCNVSCGSDDDGGNSGNTQVKLPQPTYAEQAATYTFDTGSAAKDPESGASLVGLNFTESGKAIVKVSTNSGKKYVTYDAKIEGNTYTITDNGKKIGEMQTLLAKAPTRTISSIPVKFDIEVSIPELGKSFTFKADGITARKAIETYASTVNTVNIARTWKVEQMKLTLEGPTIKTPGSITKNGGDLSQFVKEAQERGAGLTADEVAELNKTAVGLTLDKNGMFFIEYDEKTEACSWKWADENETQLRLDINDSEFGNRFYSEKSNVSVKFFASGVCNFTMQTTVTGNGRDYIATLLFVLK